MLRTSYELATSYRASTELKLASKPLQDIILFQCFIVGVNLPFLPPLHLQSLPYCNTIARPLRNIRPPPIPPIPYIIQYW